ncbi:MAG: hypothetical protein M3082_01545 [Candidatus Dormibacteraeota bacterium]|nr:hypothetical protein [Candidatus Dormibacteraeota bacterium]
MARRAINTATRLFIGASSSLYDGPTLEKVPSLARVIGALLAVVGLGFSVGGFSQECARRLLMPAIPAASFQRPVLPAIIRGMPITAVPRSCVFCGATGKLTNEHACPRRLINEQLKPGLRPMRRWGKADALTRPDTDGRDGTNDWPQKKPGRFNLSHRGDATSPAVRRLATAPKD